MSFLRILFDSFSLLRKSPHFFIPKILVAFLFLPIIVLTMVYIIHYDLFSPQSIVDKDVSELTIILFQLLFLVLYTAVVYFIDSFLINPMYPVMVQQFYEKKRIDFRQAFVAVLKRFRTIFASLMVFSVIFFAVMIPLLWIVAASLMLGGGAMFFVSAPVAAIAFFVILLLFYLIYPISSIEKLDFVGTIKKSIKTSLKHKSDVIKALLISIFVSGLSYLFSSQMILAIPFGKIELTLIFFLLLVATRFFVAVFTTYQYVLNAVFYLGFEKRLFLGE